MNDEDFVAVRIKVVVFLIAAVVIALDVFVWRP
jgi:hypothetical protein